MLAPPNVGHRHHPWPSRSARDGVQSLRRTGASRETVMAEIVDRDASPGSGFGTELRVGPIHIACLDPIATLATKRHNATV